MNEILIVAQWTTKVTRSQITLPKPSSDWPKLLKGPFQNAKIYLKKNKSHRKHYNMVCDWGLSTVLMGTMPFCGGRERNQRHVVSCKCKQNTPAAHWDVPIQSHLAMKLAAKFIFNIMKVTVIGICTRFHFNPEVGWNSIKPWHFL